MVVVCSLSFRIARDLSLSLKAGSSEVQRILYSDSSSVPALADDSSQETLEEVKETRESDTGRLVHVSVSEY